MPSASHSDVSAVVLTVGEDSTERAVAAVRGQTLPPAEIIRVDEHVSPFHRALNHGAARVKTEYFVQVDADMVLDPDCFAVLREAMGDEIGIAAGALRDSLMGKVCCVKMFRTRCFREFPAPDSIAPDTDFVAGIRNNGWKLIHALRYRCDSPAHWHTLGSHEPDYTPEYIYSKFLMAGSRVRYRNDSSSFVRLMRRLGRSEHSAAWIGQVALVEGLFRAVTRDMLGPIRETGRFAALSHLLDDDGEPGPAREPSAAPPDEVFEAWRREGVRFRASGAGRSVRHQLAALLHRGDLTSLVAAAGLCRGLASGEESNVKEDDFAVIREMLLP